MIRCLSCKDINFGIDSWKATKGAILLDVRSREEYVQRHIAGSVNVPLDSLVNINSVITDKNVPIFIHCHSGARSAAAVSFLNGNGYKYVYNIGGINRYKGQTRSH